MLPPEVSAGITTRLREVQEVLAHLRRIESSPGKPEATEVRLLRGLFYVHLYGAFEYAINRVVQFASAHINYQAIMHRDLNNPIGTIVLNAQYNAVAQASTKRRWQKRLALIERRYSSEIASIDDGAIEFQNVWLSTLEELFSVFGIKKAVMYDVAKGGYVLELTDTRNKIAHGRESPLDIGMVRRAADLQTLYEAISSQIFYVHDCFDEYLAAEAYKGA